MPRWDMHNVKKYVDSIKCKTDAKRSNERML